MNQLETLLQDNKLKKDLTIVLNRAIDGVNVNECFWAVRNITGDYQTLSAEARTIFEKEFRILLTKAQWLAVPRLKQGEILELLEKKLSAVKALDQEVFDLTETIKAYILGIVDYEERDEFKIKVRTALLNNNEILNRQTAIKEINGWLKDIISKVGIDLADKLKESEYYLQDENFKQLSNEDKGFLKSVIRLYKYCLYSSLTPEGLDETFTFLEDGKLKIFEQGQVITIPALDDKTKKVIAGFIKSDGVGQAVKDDAGVKQLQNRFHEILNKLIDKGRFQSQSGVLHPTPVILSRLNNSLALKDLTAVLADLESLILAGALDKLLKDDFQSKSLAAYLKAGYNTTAAGLIKKFSPEVLSLYSQSIFISQLELVPEEAAVLALYLANQLAKKGQREYLNIVYGDTAVGVFKWRELEIKDNKLSFK